MREYGLPTPCDRLTSKTLVLWSCPIAFPHPPYPILSNRWEINGSTLSISATNGDLRTTFEVLAQIGWGQTCRNHWHDERMGRFSRLTKSTSLEIPDKRPAFNVYCGCRRICCPFPWITRLHQDPKTRKSSFIALSAPCRRGKWRFHLVSSSTFSRENGLFVYLKMPLKT